MKRSMQEAKILKRVGHPTRRTKAEMKPPIIWNHTAVRFGRLEELVLSTLVEVRAVQREVAVR